MRMKEKHDFKLLVEGNDDLHVIMALCVQSQLPETFDIIDCNSVENVLSQFKLRLKSTNDTKRLGIIVDADVNQTARWDSIKDILNKSGEYNVPDSLPADGLILDPKIGNGIIVGIWIMPNNQLNGMLEDFIAMLAPEDDKLLEKTDIVLSEIEAEGINKYNKEFHKAKARIHTWLAWQETPGTPMGLAITKKYISQDNEIRNTFVEWLKELFVS